MFNVLMFKLMQTDLLTYLLTLIYILEMLSHLKILYYNQWQNKCNFKKGFGKLRMEADLKFLTTETAGQDLHRLIGAGVR